MRAQLTCAVHACAGRRKGSAGGHRHKRQGKPPAFGDADAESAGLLAHEARLSSSQPEALAGRGLPRSQPLDAGRTLMQTGPRIVLVAGAPGVSSSHGEEAGRVLGDAGMVLRDPSTAHLLAHQVAADGSSCHLSTRLQSTAHRAWCHIASLLPGAGSDAEHRRPTGWAGGSQVIRRLDAVVAAESSPGDDQELLFVTRLLQLGAATKAQLRAKRCRHPCTAGLPCGVDCPMSSAPQHLINVAGPPQTGCRQIAHVLHAGLQGRCLSIKCANQVRAAGARLGGCAHLLPPAGGVHHGGADAVG